MDDETTTIDLPSTECALVTSNNMEGLHFTFPNPEHQDLEDYRVPELMAYMAACYYRYFRDPEFVRQQMDWCEQHLQKTLGRDIEDRLANDNGNNDNGNSNGYNSNGYNGNGYNGNGNGYANGNGNGYRH
jgi:hypothetical protein